MSPLLFSGAKAQCFGHARRHVQILYDISESYQALPTLTPDRNRERNMGRIRQIVGTLDELDHFSFVPISDWMRLESCEDVDVDGIATFENEIRPEPLICFSPVWLGEDSLRNQRIGRLIEVERQLGWCSQTDLTGALFYAARILSFFPARKNYLLVFSDLHDQPARITGEGLCRHASLRGVTIIALNFATRLSKKTQGRRPSAQERQASFNGLLSRLGASAVLVDSPMNRVLCSVGLETGAPY